MASHFSVDDQWMDCAANPNVLLYPATLVAMRDGCKLRYTSENDRTFAKNVCHTSVPSHHIHVCGKKYVFEHIYLRSAALYNQQARSNTLAYGGGYAAFGWAGRRPVKQHTFGLRTAPTGKVK